MKTIKLMSRFAVALAAVACFSACSDDEAEPEVIIDPGVTRSHSAYVVCNGGWGKNNGTVAAIDYVDGSFGASDIYLAANGSGIGDAQDLCLVGKKLFVTSTTSSKISVLGDDGKLLKQVLLPGVEPRYIVSHDDEVYFTTYSGYVYKMDVKDYELEDSVKVGDHPEALSVVGNNLYVNVSGYGMGNTVAKVGLEPFKKLDDITVLLNPYSQSATDGTNLFFISNGNYYNPDKPFEGMIRNTLQKLDPSTGKVEQITPATVMAYDASSHSLVCIYADYYAPKEKAAFRYDIATGQKTDLPELLNVPNAGQVSVSSANGDIFVVSDDYVSPSTLYVFDMNGKQIRTIPNVGYSATKVVFWNKR